MSIQPETIGEYLDINGLASIYGDIAGGVRVNRGCELTVNGAVSSHFNVRAQAELRINGTLRITPDSKASGSVIVAGRVVGDPRDIEFNGGRIYALCGSVVEIDGQHWALGHDDSKEKFDPSVEGVPETEEANGVADLDAFWALSPADFSYRFVSMAALK